MTDDAKNLLRECLQYLYESAPAEVYDRITAHLAAPAPVTKKLNLAECATAVLDGFLGDCFPGDLPMIEAMRRQLQNLEDSLTERQLPPLPKEQK